MLDEEIRRAAIEFAKRNKIQIAKELTGTQEYVPDDFPISAFMAGSPGAGKTEFSKNLIGILEEENEKRVIRIDGDDLRFMLPGYTGKNSHIFQGAISLIIEKVHDLALHQKQSFVFDGTFSNYEKAKENINRSIDKNRIILLFYIYQKPEVAWKFTQARELAEGRNIPKEAFIYQFIHARETVKLIMEEFGNKVRVFLVKKEFERNTVEKIIRITSHMQIDQEIGKSYTKEELETCL